MTTPQTPPNEIILADLSEADLMVLGFQQYQQRENAIAQVNAANENIQRINFELEKRRQAQPK